MQEYTILLFYKYTPIADPEKLRDEQRALCERLNLKGRIIVAEEGINVTVEGRTEDTDAYLKEFLADPRFSDTHIKKSMGTGDAFPKLSVKAREEIVTLGWKKRFDLDAPKGKEITPEELKKWYETKEPGKDFYVVDLRNDYEFKVGRFKGSIMPRLENFRDVPRVLNELEDLKDKEVVTVCTGNVRCDKAADFLAGKGFTNVHHLHGGIVTYMEKFPGEEFEGSLYVFDKRITMTFDPKDKHKVIGTCEKCGTRSERYVNCKNPQCNKHFLCCEHCTENCGGAFCSDECRDKILQIA